MLIVLDTETTGRPDLKADLTAEHQPRLVQLAALLLTPDGEERGAFHAIINPEGAWTIPAEVAEIGCKLSDGPEPDAPDLAAPVPGDVRSSAGLGD